MRVSSRPTSKRVGRRAIRAALPPGKWIPPLTEPGLDLFLEESVHGRIGGEVLSSFQEILRESATRRRESMFGTMSSPTLSRLSPTTTASWTYGDSWTTISMGSGSTRSPERMTMACFMRPVMTRLPSNVRIPLSPVSSHPSAERICRVATGSL